MKDLKTLSTHDIQVVFTDIDGTITENGRLSSAAYDALWKLHDAGFKVVPVTGRPAGWCEMIARLWPVDAVIGENGGFYFQYKNQKMLRFFEQNEKEIEANRAKLDQIEIQILKEVPGSALASDQFCRLFDLAIDFCEDVPALSQADVQKIKQIFEFHGATAKVSSIHVNGWFGNFDKGSTCLKFAHKEFGWGIDELQMKAAFVGDSPNDEPLFHLFPQSFGVANVKVFASQMNSLPAYVSLKSEGSGFAEIAAHIIATKTKSKSKR